MTENKRYSFNWERGHPNFWDNYCDLADCYLTCEDVCELLNEQHETIIDNEEYIKDLEYQLKGFKKDYNDCGEYLKEYQQKVKDTLQWIYNDSKVINSKERQKAVKLIAKELGIDLQ